MPIYNQEPNGIPLQIQQPPPVQRIVYYHMATKNKSFLDMHHFLESIGIKNNKFMLALFDPDLAYVNPLDPNLNSMYKQKVFRECLCNYWYWLREVVRIPTPGGLSAKYELNRGNLAYNFCNMLNLNTFFEMPRQCGKTMSVLVRYLYIYTYGTTNSKIAFMHKDASGSRDNLQTLKDLRDLLPDYLKLAERPLPDGKTDKGKDNVTGLVNPFNNNAIRAYSSAVTRAKAASLLRGKTISNLWYDEFAFIPYNDIIYLNAAPALRTAFDIAEKNGSPYGVSITTTSGFLETSEGKVAYEMREKATEFAESFYDLTYDQLKTILNANKRSNFVHIIFGYQELGKDEAWFNRICLDMSLSWVDIRREVLLQWQAGVTDSPFDPDDLETIRSLVKPPISVVYLLGKYRFESYLQADTILYPPIIGVDVAAGYKQDSSTITVIDSKTTKVLGCMNCNYISTVDLARCLEVMIKEWMPNAIVCVERNGGYGTSVIANLIKAGCRANLYYEIKDKVVEERQDGVHAYRQKIRTKVYGINSTKDVRKQLIDLLMERVQYHKDKFISPIIYQELTGMQIKKNGKIEHSDATHDDQIFSLLMALYCWYYGTNLGERYGIKKSAITTDEDIDETIDYFEPNNINIVDQFGAPTEIDEITNDTIKKMNNPKVELLNDYLNRTYEEERQRFYDLVNTPLGAKGYKEKYNIPEDTNVSDLISGGENSGGMTKISDKVFNDFYNINVSRITNDIPTGENNVIPEGAILSINDDNYNYFDHFNF